MSRYHFDAAGRTDSVYAPDHPTQAYASTAYGPFGSTKVTIEMPTGIPVEVCVPVTVVEPIVVTGTPPTVGPVGCGASCGSGFGIPPLPGTGSGPVQAPDRPRGPVLVRRTFRLNKGWQVVNDCIAAGEAVLAGTRRAVFGLPLFPLESAFNGRVPDIKPGLVPGLDPRELQPSSGWDFYRDGLEKAAPAFARYRDLGCSGNVFQW